MTTTPPPPDLLTGKVAIVTGGSMGIGEAARRILRGCGCCGVSGGASLDRLQAVAERIRRAGGRAACIETDISDKESVERLVAFTVERFGQVDIGLNNAGMNPSGQNAIDDYDMEEFRQIDDVKVMGVAYCLKHQIRAMKSAGKGGAIVNHSSIIGLTGQGGLYPAASASQAAIIGLTRAAAASCAPLGIRVNALAIGGVHTGYMGALSTEEQAAIAAHVPLGRIGQGGDVAAQAAWLCSDHSS